MYRRFLAILLIGPWVLLSHLDLLEDFESANRFGAYCDSCCNGRSLPSSSSSVKTINNIVESADHRQPCNAGLFEFSSVHFSVDPGLSFKKPSRLHKLHRVFLI
jgi:hypothetical protein